MLGGPVNEKSGSGGVALIRRQWNHHWGNPLAMITLVEQAHSFKGCSHNISHSLNRKNDSMEWGYDDYIILT